MGFVDDTIVGFGRAVTLIGVFAGLLLLWTGFWTVGIVFIEQYVTLPTVAIGVIPERFFGVNVILTLGLGLGSTLVTFLLGFVPSFVRG